MDAFAVSGEGMVQIVHKLQTAEAFYEFVKEHLAEFSEEVQDTAKAILASWEGRTTTQWGPRRIS